MTARFWSSIPRTSHDVRLVVSDLDGTLLAGDGAVPATFWPLLERMNARGITFVPASGRQYATLARMFAQAPAGTPFIAENGTLVVRDGDVLCATCIDVPTVKDVIHKVRDATEPARDLGLVVCGRRSAYIERRDTEFITEAERYYAQLTAVGDLTTVTDDVLKLAIYDLAGVESTTRSIFAPLEASHQIAVSGKHWIDIMPQGANKGRAVQQLQQALGVTAAQTAVFGDYLNDLEMLDHADLSFAMGNAHPLVRSRARYIAPTNEEHGVVTALSHLLS
ncbi:Cof-type HAD-IIB family hydrolase [Arthrobacter sp. I2-34]|uniref:Cof-type HAD-IIB family hydrolase n=1 Tax=Arthrobacter hankyongi TaxID=2904801 RepID=A0ABS9LBS7_9MICC|nr:HAD family hydrolase [Arthrobacter hankyongi]MCG2623924.1 Cof-type HAD-IIB family hydrolase [Arthrobacter hankyongi]